MNERKPSDWRKGDRVELSPACDLWMRGARFGTVERIGRKWVTVKLDRLARAVRFAPDYLLPCGALS